MRSRAGRRLLPNMTDGMDVLSAGARLLVADQFYITSEPGAKPDEGIEVQKMSSEGTPAPTSRRVHIALTRTSSSWAVADEELSERHAS